MSNCNDIDTILRRNGTGQIERFIKQLDPATFELNDFDIEDWIIFTYSFAKHVNYFHTSDSTTVQGDWQDFFNCFDFGDPEIPFRTSRTYKNYKENITQTLNTFKEDGRLTPHLTLFYPKKGLMHLLKDIWIFIIKTSYKLTNVNPFQIKFTYSLNWLKKPSKSK